MCVFHDIRLQTLVDDNDFEGYKLFCFRLLKKKKTKIIISINWESRITKIITNVEESRGIGSIWKPQKNN